MMPDMQKQVVVIAGPTGTGKDSIIGGVIARYPRCTRLVTATTRAMRPGEEDAKSYYFFSKERFLEEVREGNIIEYNYRAQLDTYYGTYKPDLESKLAEGKIVLAQVQIVGARYLQEHYGATTIFVMPQSRAVLEARIRGRDHTLSDEEVHARFDIAEQETKEDAPQYDYQIRNDQGKLDAAVEAVVEILRKEGYTLE